MALATFVVLAFAGAASARSPRVWTPDGTVAGATSGPVVAFLGIPYAASTAGANRWRAPQPAAKWAGVRDATRFGPNCTQEPPYAPPGGSPWTDEYQPSGPMSEDCLTLNVWTPAKRSAARLPVMVWVHGGGFAGGSGSVPIYDGKALAARGIVVVTINYRVGVLGFLAHPWLTAEAGTSGNYGLLDQVAALRWVRRTIARFGGDPARVTLAGQSAGAASVHDLLAMPAAAGLFSQAIAESGSGMGLSVMALPQAETLGAGIADKAAAKTLAALRATSPEKLMQAMRDPSFGGAGARLGPISDPMVLPDPARERQDVPILTGLNADENSLSADWMISGPQQLTSLLHRTFGADAPRFAPLYADANPQAAARQILRDRGIAGLMAWYQGRGKSSAAVYAYLFDHTEPGPTRDRFGVFHSSEIPYVFGTLDAAPRPFSVEDRALSAQLGNDWAAFVQTGTPALPGESPWPTLAEDRLVVFNGMTASAIPALAPAKVAAYRSFVAAGGEVGLFTR